MTTIATESQTVFIENDELVVESLRISDPDAVNFVAASDDPELALVRCVEMGARVLRLANATVDTQVVEHRFNEMTQSLDRSVDELARRIDDSARALLDDESGELTAALRTWLTDVTSVLGATFDETSKKSAIAKLETVLETARGEQVTAVRRLLDPENAESPLNRWRSDIVSEVRDRGEAVERLLSDLSFRLGLDQGEAATIERTAVKGFDFEDVVYAALEVIASPLQDVPCMVGNEAGAAAAKVGDIVVDVDPSLARREARYVVECKDRALPLKKALDELDLAMANRDAQAGLMVFSSADLAPGTEPFQWFDRRAIVVLDKDDLDPLALRLACLWARWVATRDASDVTEEIDLDRLAAVIQSANRGLKTAASVRSSHTQAKKAIDQAGRQFDALLGDVQSALDELESLLSFADS
jgi:hypothetical protein